MITVEEITSLLNLKPHPKEGGYFAETYRSQQHLPDGGEGKRALATAIYYLLKPDTFSEMHRLPADKVFHFYLGDPVEMIQLLPDGSGKVITLGPDILNGMHLQAIVLKGVWQGAKLLPGGKFALLGTTMSPGFEFADYESGKRDVLVELYPQFRDLISILTR